MNTQGLPLSVDEWVALRCSEALWQTERHTLWINISFVPFLFHFLSFISMNPYVPVSFLSFRLKLSHHPILWIFTSTITIPFAKPSPSPTRYPAATARRDVAVCKLQEHRPQRSKEWSMVMFQRNLVGKSWVYESLSLVCEYVWVIHIFQA